MPHKQTHKDLIRAWHSMLAKRGISEDPRAKASITDNIVAFTPLTRGGPRQAQPEEEVLEEKEGAVDDLSG
jgi:hypothetical protein